MQRELQKPKIHFSLFFQGKQELICCFRLQNIRNGGANGARGVRSTRMGKG